MSTSGDILNYWFDDLRDDAPMDKESPTVKKWFIKDESIDREIRKRFEGDLMKAKEGGYASWEKSLQGRLALIILFDQFSRNMYRDTPGMFATDPQALKLTLRSLEEKTDEDIPFIHRVFLYMPLMHGEDLAIQNLSILCFEKLLKQARQKNNPNASSFEGNLEYAKKHRVIVERFGRFPHRNQILKRSSTPQEEEFLKTPGSSF